MTAGTLRAAPAVRARRRGDAYRLCASLADLLAEALKLGDEGAAKRYAQDLRRVEKVAQEEPEGLTTLENSLGRTSE